MKLGRLISIYLFLLVFVGCSTYKSNTAKWTDVQNTAVIAVPTIADLDVSPNKITGFSSSNQKSISEIKTDAIVEALGKENADVLVEPRYRIEVTGSQKSVEVTGYPATYKNFRNFTSQDTLWLYRFIYAPPTPAIKKGD